MPIMTCRLGFLKLVYRIGAVLKYIVFVCVCHVCVAVSTVSLSISRSIPVVQLPLNCLWLYNFQSLLFLQNWDCQPKHARNIRCVYLKYLNLILWEVLSISESAVKHQELCPFSEDLHENWGPPPGELNTDGQDLLIYGTLEPHFRTWETAKNLPGWML